MGEQAATGSRGAFGVPRCQAVWDSVDRLLDDWARERPDLDFRPVGIISRLAKVRTHLDVGVTEVFTKNGLTAADFLVIVTLRRSGRPYRMPQARLMNALELTSGTVSVRLDRLERLGLVVREMDPDNARSTQVRLTEAGLAQFDVVAPDHLANEDRLLSALSDAERQTLADLLRRLLSSFEQAPAVGAALGLELESAPSARGRRQAVGLSDTAGLLVAGVLAGSAAERAGLVRGDLIVDVDRVPMLNTVALAERLDRAADGQRMRFTVLRGDERARVTVVNVARPAWTNVADLGPE